MQQQKTQMIYYISVYIKMIKEMSFDKSRVKF